MESAQGHRRRCVLSATLVQMSSRLSDGPLGWDRLDRPPVTHRLDGQAASAATADRQDAPSPDPKALHRDLREGIGPRQLAVAPAVLGKALAYGDRDNLRFPPPGTQRPRARRRLRLTPRPSRPRWSREDPSALR
jgi:hypothetical protein